MKNYDEVTRDVFIKAQAVKREKTKRKKRILALVCGILPCLVVLFLGIGIVRSLADGGIQTPTTESDSEEPESLPRDWPTVSPYLSVQTIDDEGAGMKTAISIGDGSSSGSNSAELASRSPYFTNNAIHVLARVKKAFPEEYSYMNYYGTREKCKLYLMELIDPLDSGMVGDFYFAVDYSNTRFEELDANVDLTAYDVFLLAMYQQPLNSVLASDDQILVFSFLFSRGNSVGDIVPFTDGIFDDSLFYIRTYEREHPHIRRMLETGEIWYAEEGELHVRPGMTLKDAIKALKAYKKANSEAVSRSVVMYEMISDEIKAAFAEMDACQIGVFAPSVQIKSSLLLYSATLFVNGIPTNYRIQIDFTNQTVTRYGTPPQADDLAAVPSIRDYIDAIDVETLHPEHIDTSGKTLTSLHVRGYYEMTESGLVGVVVASFYYRPDDDHYLSYVDQSYVLLDENGSCSITKEDLLALVGEQSYIEREAFGTPIPLPM